MLYATSPIAIGIFLFFVGTVLGLSFYLGRKAKSAKGYYAAHGQIGWFTNGIAFAGDYLSAASFLGICGLIAFFGYDGFLYSIGYLAGWIVALFVIAEPIKRLGKFTFADALDSQFNSSGIKLAAALSTLIVSVFYLIPQMVGAGALITPLLGLPHWIGVVLVGVTVTIIVVTAGMVSTTWVQFIKGSLLVIFCTILVGLILYRGLTARPVAAARPPEGAVQIDATGWMGKPYVRYKTLDGRTLVYRVVESKTSDKPTVIETQVLTATPGGKRLVNGLPQTAENDLHPVGTIAELPEGKTETGPLGPTAFLQTLHDSSVVTWSKETLKEADGTTHDIYYPVTRKGADVLAPGGYFKGLKSEKFADHLDFISLMLALFCGTASLPHILIRYYTVKDQAAARKSTIVGIGAIGFFYILTLFLGLGAMTSGAMDPTNNNMAAPLLAKSFNTILFAIISAIAFTTVLGTVSGLIMAGAGAVAHDVVETLFRIENNDHTKVLIGKISAGMLGMGAVVLGILFKEFNVSVLVGWAFNIAASANLPALIMLLFWKRTTAKGIAAAIVVGLGSSLGWILLSADTYDKVYHIDKARSIIPFSQPALVTIPLGFVVLIVVSLMTKRTTAEEKRVAGVTAGV